MSRVFRKRSSRGRPSGSSSATFAGDRYRQTLTAFGTTTIDDIASTRRLHSSTETVTTLSFDLAWLIRTLHGNLRGGGMMIRRTADCFPQERVPNLQTQLSRPRCLCCPRLMSKDRVEHIDRRTRARETEIHRGVPRGTHYG